MHDGRRRTVAAADHSARSLGLLPGMPVAQAQALIPGLTVVPAQPEGDARALEELAAWCLRYAPLTAPDRPDGVWIDATGCSHLFGGEASMLADVVERLDRGGVASRAAIADTAGAAWATARYAKAAVTVVPAGETVAALRAAADRRPAPERRNDRRPDAAWFRPHRPASRRSPGAAHPAVRPRGHPAHRPGSGPRQ